MARCRRAGGRVAGGACRRCFSASAWRSSTASPDPPIIVLAIAGAYAGWLLGVIVFGAVRGAETDRGPRPDDQEERS